MKTLYLHIGLQKTGTTSIQVYFIGARSPLVAAGIDFLPAAIAPKNAHHNAAREMCRHKRYDPTQPGMDALVAAAHASGKDRLFVSSEDFSFLNDKEVQALADRLSAFDVKVILCLRNQLDWTESLFAQACKRGHVGKFSDFADRLAADGKLNFRDLIARWSDAFGAGNLNLMIYEDQADISTAFARLLGVELAKAPARKNQSLNERFVLASQDILERCKAGRLSSKGRLLEAGATAAVSKSLLAIGAGHDVFTGSPVFLDRDEAQTYLDQSRVINAAVQTFVSLPDAYFNVQARRRDRMSLQQQDVDLLTTALFADPDLRPLQVSDARTG